MSNYALVNAAGVITNRIVLDDAGWTPPDGFTLALEAGTTYEIGGTIINGVYTPPAAPAPPAPPPITSVTPRQARLALLSAGLLDQVEAAVKVAGGATQITWKYATTIERNSPLIETLGTSLGLTEAQIDALFTQASRL